MKGNAFARRLSRRIVVVMLAVTSWPALVAAQSGADLRTATLEDLLKITVTTASRHAEGAADAPAQIEVVTARQIQVRGYRSLAELLRDQLGIKNELGSDPDYPSEFTVQGSRGSGQIVLLLDGIRVTSPTGEPLPIMANYPVHNARQVEILFGPASALYGADAFSAVVNVISKDAADTEGFSASAAIGQFGLSNNTATYTRRIGQSGSLFVSGQWFGDAQADLSSYYPELYQGLQAQHTGVFNTIFGPMSPSRTTTTEFENPISARSFHAAFSAGGFNVSLLRNRQRASTSSPYTPDNAVYSKDVFQQNDLWVAAGSYTREFRGLTSTSTVTWGEHTMSPESGYWNVFSNLHRSFKYAYGSSVKGEQQLSWSRWARTVFSAGAVFESFFAIPQVADLNEPIRSRHVPGTILDTTIIDEFNRMQYSNTGGYVQGQYAPNRRVTLTVGARSDYNSRYGFTVNPRVGVVAKPRSGTTVKLLYGTAFLAPTPYQSTAHYGSFYSTDNGATYASDYWHVGNPDLKPQQKSTLQATLMQSLGPLFNVSATVFNSRMKDVIKHSDPDQAGPGLYHGWPVAYIDFPVNEGNDNTVGGSVDAAMLKSWSPTRRVEARFGVSVVDGEVEDDDNPTALQISGIAPFQLRSRVDLELGPWTGSAGVMTFGRQRVVALAADEAVRQTLPGFTTVDLNIRRNRITRNLDAFFRVENLFDARYFHINERAFSSPEELAGSPQAPRRISVGIDVRVGK
jgi:outer membrane cobalamin receptor